MIQEATLRGCAIPLYVENGVYNFYVQDESYRWNPLNLDTGAASTVVPRSMRPGGRGQAEML